MNSSVLKALRANTGPCLRTPQLGHGRWVLELSFSSWLRAQTSTPTPSFAPPRAGRHPASLASATAQSPASGARRLKPVSGKEAA